MNQSPYSSALRSLGNVHRSIYHNGAVTGTMQNLTVLLALVARDGKVEDHINSFHRWL
jgi:uncharacterized membrane protein